MASRYENLEIIRNNSLNYYNYLKNKGYNPTFGIEQYQTPFIKPVTDQIKNDVFKKEHVWASGDKYYTISNYYYDEPNLWWLIAWFNSKPTEQHISIGEIIYIPLPLDRILSYWRGV